MRDVMLTASLFLRHKPGKPPHKPSVLPRHRALLDGVHPAPNLVRPERVGLSSDGQRTFEDLDGHTWEPFWMDPTHVQQT